MKRERDLPRVRANRWYNEASLGVGLALSLEMFSGLSVRFEASLLGFGGWIQIRVFYSARMERRSQDRFQAGMLAGDYPGITLTTHGDG